MGCLVHSLSSELSSPASCILNQVQRVSLEPSPVEQLEVHLSHGQGYPEGQSFSLHLTVFDGQGLSSENDGSVQPALRNLETESDTSLVSPGVAELSFPGALGGVTGKKRKKERERDDN